ncbi:nucleotidyltransferase domain-containing protein [Halonotius terrestris]|uniref:Nucleotidyltransferase domain-containing protein n=1 Tax=Halonotius terrestris TaxID=2487750 RepID=A0A8J8P7X1_9EURY|nr:nucleotidyltransferase domain-containing protein [Halonotius terrestris]TQQ81325.1 nucleotidyltransferase domain-containing protein [Halonotius terrestris]
MSTADERPSDGDRHTDAATAFVRRVRKANIDGLESLILFGSTARGEAAGLDSDVDFLVVVGEAADTDTVENTLRDIAYDVMLEYGPVVEVHTVSESTFEQRREHPFVRQAMRDGEMYG